MGEEAPEVPLNSLNEISPPVGESRSVGYQTSTIIGNKTYVIEESDDGDNSSLGVKVFDHSAGSWFIPTILGIKPVQFKGHSAAALSNDRIVIVKTGAPLDDCFWFLEVDTPHVREQKKTLGTEVVAWSKVILGNSPKPIVISGPSGVGKGTLISKLMEEFPSKYGFSVSHTTRAPREKEIDGIHYHFTERSIMEKDIRDGKFLEFASVHGNLYGTSIEAVEAVADSGKRCVLDIDVQGARQVRVSPLEATFIFICPPSFEELEKRLRARGTETEEQIQKRLRNARTELEQGKSAGFYDHVLVNDDLDSCYENLKKLLASDESTDIGYQPSLKNFKVPVSRIIPDKDQKVVIQCGTKAPGAPTPSLFSLDLSSCKGGAPGRTRGLDVHAVESSGNGLCGLEEL